MVYIVARKLRFEWNRTVCNPSTHPSPVDRGECSCACARTRARAYTYTYTCAHTYIHTHTTHTHPCLSNPHAHVAGTRLLGGLIGGGGFLAGGCGSTGGPRLHGGPLLRRWRRLRGGGRLCHTPAADRLRFLARYRLGGQNMISGLDPRSSCRRESWFEHRLEYSWIEHRQAVEFQPSGQPALTQPHIELVRQKNGKIEIVCLECHFGNVTGRRRRGRGKD